MMENQRTSVHCKGIGGAGGGDRRAWAWFSSGDVGQGVTSVCLDVWMGLFANGWDEGKRSAYDVNLDMWELKLRSCAEVRKRGRHFVMEVKYTDSMNQTLSAWVPRGLVFRRISTNDHLYLTHLDELVEDVVQPKTLNG